ncbi:DUF6777 domain-containing protein [Actinomadura syzygii]|uniref:DUF6777 domain-containing protein n=1 Tax=Actinomadura syzygii TaxID=1427538 RepID=A0A5D0U3P4_9ACTN|nr:DUF6777 domain-containing protein [Actinomadura syzygii]TYC12296.1 hypothetical protein FXF65_23825 [Actinomadura syzygii]
MPEIHSRIARRRSRVRSAAVAATALALVATALSACGDAGATITRLTVGTPGPDPYTLVANTDKTDVKHRPQAGGTKTGDSPGLYGGTRQTSTCDQQKLVAFLQANPDKAKAWAAVQGIPVSDIPRYVSRLTPVLLRTDTLVTNHGYHDGRATAAPAVLQAGMGVLINGYGVPTVKCNCGNPLTRPKEKISSGKVSYTGRSWSGFTKRNVTEIQPRDSRKGTIESFVLVDPEATMGFERPRATEGESDGPPTELPATETEVPTSDSPAPTDSGLDSPTVDSPGPESPGTESPGTETPSPEVSSGSPGVPSENPGTGGGDPGTGGGIEQPGGTTQGPMSLPPSEEPAPTVS